MPLKYAILIDADTLPLVIKLNDGVGVGFNPDAFGRYFVTPADNMSFEYNDFLSLELFFDMYPDASRTARMQVLR